MSECQDVNCGCTLTFFYYFSGLCYRETEVATLKYSRQRLDAVFPTCLFSFHMSLRNAFEGVRNRPLILQLNGKLSPPMATSIDLFRGGRAQRVMAKPFMRMRKGLSLVVSFTGPHIMANVGQTFATSQPMHFQNATQIFAYQKVAQHELDL